MPDGLSHGGVLPIGNPKFFGGLLHNPGQRSIVGMAHERAQMVDDVMVEPASEPTDERVFRRIIGRCCEDVIHAVLKLTTVRGKVGAVDGVRRLNTSVTAKPTNKWTRRNAPATSRGDFPSTITGKTSM